MLAKTNPQNSKGDRLYLFRICGFRYPIYTSSLVVKYGSSINDKNLTSPFLLNLRVNCPPEKILEDGIEKKLTYLFSKYFDPVYTGIKFEISSLSVSYTHLTLPTTPYV
jgi:hypothetical protein